MHLSVDSRRSERKSCKDSSGFSLNPPYSSRINWPGPTGNNSGFDNYSCQKSQGSPWRIELREPSFATQPTEARLSSQSSYRRNPLEPSWKNAVSLDFWTYVDSGQKQIGEQFLSCLLNAGFFS